jgi:lysophospholipid acyltransferase (LPLAT)-like uncharacterized protein
VKLHKRILKSDGVRHALCWLGALYIRLVRATAPWQVVNGDVPQAYWDQGKPFILAFWHGRLLMMPYVWPREKTIHMLISQHRDGQIIARTVGHFGIRTVAGSSSKGGAAALRAMVKALKGGEYVGITPDGPRGPRMHASDGIVAVARLAGVPVIPAAFGARRRKVLGTWDRFVIARPFSGGVFVWGEAIEVAKNADPESARAEIEAALNAVTAEADRLTGQEPVAPAVVDKDVLEPLT